MAPGINGPNTVFEGGVNETSARIANEAGSPQVQRIICAGIFDGVFEERPALEIGNEGESPDGTLLQITFDAILDLDQPWELRIPSDTPLIQSRYGGRLTGSFTDGEPPTLAVGGYVRQSSIVAAAGAMPPLIWPVAIGYTDPDTFYEVALSGAPDPITIVGLPPMTSGTAGPATGVADQGGGVLLVNFAVSPGPGASLNFPAWHPSIRGPGGEWMTPFSINVP